MIPAALLSEVRRELELRTRALPPRVTSGNLLADDAQRQIAIAAAWVADLERLAAHPVGKLPPPAHDIPWRERHGELLREQARRERHYPRHVQEGRMLAADAETRLASLAAIIRLYEDGPLYQSRTGAMPRHHSYDRTPEQAEAMCEWLEMQHSRAQARGDQDRARWMAACLKDEGIIATAAAA